MDKTPKEVILALIELGADITRIGKATEYKDITVEELQKLNQEKGLAFTYESAKDELVITRDLA